MIDLSKEHFCRVCGNGCVFSLAFSKKGINYLKCRCCDHVFVPPYYREDIDYTNYKSAADYKAVVEGNDWLKIQRNILRFRTLRKYLKRGQILDVGSGWGHFIYTAQQLGYGAMGLEMAIWPRNYARDYLNVPVVQTDFFDFEVPYKYDMVTMWDVLEHIERCDLAIEKAGTFLKDGGYLVLQVPRLDSFIAKRLGIHWQSIGKDHVNYFTKKTITLLLNSKGFTVKQLKSSIEVKLFVMYTFYNRKRIRQSGAGVKITAAERQNHYNRLVDRPKWMLRIMVFTHNLLYNLLSFLNIGDEMMVIAKKNAHPE